MLTLTWSNGGSVVATNLDDNTTIGGPGWILMEDVDAGTTIRFTAVPDAGFRVAGWTHPGTPLTGGTGDLERDLVNMQNNATIHVIFEQIPTHTVTFDVDGGSYVPAATVESGETATRPVPDPTKTGYTFVGWFTNPTGGVPWAFPTRPVTADVTIYARWTQTTRTVTFDAQSGTPTPDSETVADGGTVTEPPAPTRTGYTNDPTPVRTYYRLLGWSINSSGTPLWNFASDVVVDNDITLYAVWELCDHDWDESNLINGVVHDLPRLTVAGEPDNEGYGTVVVHCLHCSATRTQATISNAPLKALQGAREAAWLLIGLDVIVGVWRSELQQNLLPKANALFNQLDLFSSGTHAELQPLLDEMTNTADEIFNVLALAPDWEDLRLALVGWMNIAPSLGISSPDLDILFARAQFLINNRDLDDIDEMDDLLDEIVKYIENL
jgi:uncharacterized repeat protein (TIGR02543 family)